MFPVGLFTFTKQPLQQKNGPIHSKNSKIGDFRLWTAWKTTA